MALAACVLRATIKKVNFFEEKSASGWLGWRIFWPRNDLAPLLCWRHHWSMVTSRLRLKRRYHSNCEEARTWRDKREFVSSDLKLVCFVKATGAPCRSPANGISVVDRPYSAFTVWLPTGPLCRNCCSTGALRYPLGRCQWWSGCSGFSRHVSSL